MRGDEMPPVEVSTAQLEPLDDQWLSLELRGSWCDVAAASHQLVLVVDGEDRRHRFPAVPRPRPAAGPAVTRFEARFNVPASLEGELGGRMTLLVGETAVAVPELGPTVERTSAADGAAGDAGLLAPLREELAERARVEARLRAELASLRAREDGRGPLVERLEGARGELADELVRVRRALEAHEQRRDEECDALRARVAELEAELTAARREAVTLRTAELTARAGREAALAEAGALREELERLAAGAPAAESGDLELERAEALLAEARSLTDSLG